MNNAGKLESIFQLKLDTEVICTIFFIRKTKTSVIVTDVAYRKKKHDMD